MKNKNITSKSYYPTTDRNTGWIIYYFYKLLGLAPFSLRVSKKNNKVNDLRKNNNKVLSFTKSNLNLIYICGLLLIISTACSMTFPTIINNQNTDYVLRNGFRRVKVFIAMIVMIIIWCFMIIKKNNLVHILSRISQADSGLNMFSDVCHLESSEIQIMIVFIFNIIVWICLCVFEYIVHDNINVWICNVFPNFIIYWYIMQYTFVLIIIEKRFKNINDGFMILSKSNIEPIYNNNGDVSTVSLKKFIQCNFHSLQQGYTVYSEVCQSISKYYSIPTLLSIALASGSIVYCSYYIIHPIIFTKTSRPLMSTVCWIFWLLIHSLHVFFLSFSVTRLENEVHVFLVFL